ncbi:hypothetical protein OBP_291 [Pseudomonas phage OBP]|uniref:hypothetical protein n=1 Tax=Pseudomonas phage OBP TaxID=1124849 RepID=UPI000240D63E|nr:hypothetical protein OBP_291 [Pseudomonas phage OBP]AEV89728.1 hypothetical protein OBP_291 [Pseudomonas phage OBP]
MTVAKITTLEELIDIAEPKSICLLLEVEHGFTYGDADRDCKNVQRIEHMLNRIESVGTKGDLEIMTFLVSRRPIPEGHAQIIPVYVFIDPKDDWSKTKSSDLTIIKRIDNKVEVAGISEEFEIPLRTLLD